MERDDGSSPTNRALNDITLAIIGNLKTQNRLVRCQTVFVVERLSFRLPSNIASVFNLCCRIHFQAAPMERRRLVANQSHIKRHRVCNK